MKYKVTRPVFHKGCNYMTGQIVETESELISPAFQKIEETPEDEGTKQQNEPAETIKTTGRRKGKGKGRNK